MPRFRIVLTALLAALPFLAHSQQWPAKPLRVIVPNSAGSAPDIVMRLVGDRVGQTVGQAVVVDNRPGGNGILAAELAAKAPADGYNYFLASQDSHATALYRYKSIPYDPDRDFVPVANVVDSVPFVIAVHSSVPARTYPELVALAKSQPLTMGVSVSIGDVLARWMNFTAGTPVTIVPYKTNPQLAQDAVSGQVQSLAIGLPAIDAFIKSGKLRAIAVSSSKRFPSLPDLPTLSETYPGLVIEGWIFLVAPTGTPAPIIQRVNRAVDAAVKAPEVVQRFQAFGLSGNDALTPEAIQQRVAQVRASWKKISADIKLDIE